MKLWVEPRPSHGTDLWCDGTNLWLYDDAPRPNYLLVLILVWFNTYRSISLLENLPPGACEK